MKPDAPIFIAGPTGTGKSAVAAALAEKIGGAVVNADAFQLYDGLDTLTAKPSAEERARAPHHLYGEIPLSSECDAARYASLANPRINKILCAQQQTPVIVGGSGLYLKSLTHGLSSVPPSDPELRRQLEQIPLVELIEELRQRDPVEAAKINLKNPRYVVRAVEICRQSGKPASLLKSAWENQNPNIRGVFLTRDREDLYDRINRRTDRMLDDGAIDEVQDLKIAGTRVSNTATKAIGFTDILRYLGKEISRDVLVDSIQTATRRYSKRQQTWFRRESYFHRIELTADECPDAAADRISRCEAIQ